MKRLPMILSLAAPYVLIPVIYLTNTDLEIGIAIYALILLFNMVYAFFLPRLGFQGKQLLFWNMLLKLCLIPFCLFVFLFVLIIGLIGAQRLDVPALLLAGFLVCYLPQLANAPFALSGLLQYRKGNCIGTGGVVAFSLAQTVPLADIVCAIVCFVLLRRRSIQEEDRYE